MKNMNSIKLEITSTKEAKNMRAPLLCDFFDKNLIKSSLNILPEYAQGILQMSRSEMPVYPSIL
jgi:hypothetical protein